MLKLGQETVAAAVKKVTEGSRINRKKKSVYPKEEGKGIDETRLTEGAESHPAPAVHNSTTPRSTTYGNTADQRRRDRWQTCDQLLRD